MTTRKVLVMILPTMLISSIAVALVMGVILGWMAHHLAHNREIQALEMQRFIDLENFEQALANFREDIYKNPPDEVVKEILKTKGFT